MPTAKYKFFKIFLTYIFCFGAAWGGSPAQYALAFWHKKIAQKDKSLFSKIVFLDYSNGIQKLSVLEPTGAICADSLRGNKIQICVIKFDDNNTIFDDKAITFDDAGGIVIKEIVKWWIKNKFFK